MGENLPVGSLFRKKLKNIKWWREIFTDLQSFPSSKKLFQNQRVFTTTTNFYSQNLTKRGKNQMLFHCCHSIWLLILKLMHGGKWKCIFLVFMGLPCIPSQVRLCEYLWLWIFMFISTFFLSSFIIPWSRFIRLSIPIFQYGFSSSSSADSCARLYCNFPLQCFVQYSASGSSP